MKTMLIWSRSSNIFSRILTWLKFRLKSTWLSIPLYLTQTTHHVLVVKLRFLSHFIGADGMKIQIALGAEHVLKSQANKKIFIMDTVKTVFYLGVNGRRLLWKDLEATFNQPNKISVSFKGIILDVTVVEDAQMVMDRPDTFVWDAEMIPILVVTILTCAKSALKDILKEIRSWGQSCTIKAIKKIILCLGFCTTLKVITSSEIIKVFRSNLNWFLCLNLF